MMKPPGFKWLLDKAKRHRIITTLFIILAIALFCINYIACSIWFFDATSPGATAEAAIVLGASVSDGRPSPVFQARIDHAVTLYQEGRVNTIILTGGKPPGSSLSEAEVARNYAIAQGVPPQDAYFETQSRTTKENLIYAQRLAEKKGIESFVIVSDPLHLKRAMLIADSLNMNCLPSATPTTRYTGWKSKAKFTARETYFYLTFLLSSR